MLCESRTVVIVSHNWSWYLTAVAVEGLHLNVDMQEAKGGTQRMPTLVDSDRKRKPKRCLVYRRKLKPRKGSMSREA